MKTFKAPQKNVAWSAASIPALLLLGAICGSAVASTDIPCPDSAKKIDDTLHAILASDDSDAALADTSADEKAEDTSETVESPVNESATPELTTRLPGVSANDMPRFRRHMFRTDI